jgi:hypothetical protein
MSVTELRARVRRKETTSRGAGGTGRVGIELGGILAALGLVKATAGAEVRTDYEKILEITSSLSTENRMVSAAPVPMIVHATP